MIPEIQDRTELQGIVQMQTRALWGDVFEKPNALARLAEIIRPLHSNHVRHIILSSALRSAICF